MNSRVVAQYSSPRPAVALSWVAMALHGGQPVLQSGAPLDQASAAMILLHGRGASAADIMTIADEVRAPGWSYLAPQAANGTWYPHPFASPIDANEPWLSSALGVVHGLVASVEAALPLERLVLLGFSQGACLTLEYAARNARRYGGVVGLTGGLIGPDTGPRDRPGALDGTPIFIGSSDVDPHIPAARVEHAAAVLAGLGGDVTARLYPGMGHTVNQDEIHFVSELVASISESAAVSPP